MTLMSAKKNCWEIKGCGREPGGSAAGELGVCPAAEESSCDCINSGKNAGRFCWAIAGTFCSGTIQGMFALKIETCLKCEVFHLVSEEEGSAFVMHKEELLPRT